MTKHKALREAIKAATETESYADVRDPQTAWCRIQYRHLETLRRAAEKVVEAK